MRHFHIFIGVLAFILAVLIIPGLSYSQTCPFYANSSNRSYSLGSSLCSNYRLYIAAGVSNANITCNRSSIISNATFLGRNSYDFLDNCSFSSSRIKILNGSMIYVVSPSGAFTPEFSGNGSNLTVAYRLTVNVFEPYGYNSTRLFGARVAGFGYLLPLFNNTIHLNESQLTPVDPNNAALLQLIKNMSAAHPFAAYNENETQIFMNVTNLTYGRIFGSKSFLVLNRTIYPNRTLNYNPYHLVYSFIGFDQLVYFNLTITKNINLTPLYIQPLFPKFNYYILPDNNESNITISYLVAVPPQDSGWNFTTYLYRYFTGQGFTVNPLGTNVSPATLIKWFAYPSDNYTEMYNGTRLYVLSYDAKVAIGLNSSITITPGNAGRNIQFRQDSTTPNFSYGLAFCALLNNSGYPYSAINQSGYYNMVRNLLPVSNNGPVYVNALCSVGAYISGRDININCRNGQIRDYRAGMIFHDASNITVNNCNIFGNGLVFINSSNVRVGNMTLSALSNVNNSSAINITNSSGLSFYNLSISGGFDSAYSQSDSNDIRFANLQANQSAMLIIDRLTSTPSNSSPTHPTVSPTTPIPTKSSGRGYGVYVAAAGVAIVYIYLFIRLTHKKGKKKHKYRLA